MASNSIPVFLTTAQVAELLSISPNHLRALVRANTGPAVCQFGPRSGRYRLADVLAWANATAAPAGTQPLPTPPEDA